LLQSLRAPEGISPRAGFYGRVMDRVDSQRKSSIWSVFLEPAFSFRLAAASLALMLLMGVALYTGGSETEEQIALDQPQSQVVFVNNENEPAPALVNGSVDALHAAPVSMMDAEHGREVVLVDLVSYQEH
jgi:hypothetical protein